MTIHERIEQRIVELNALIAKHDREARDCRAETLRAKHREVAAGYAQAKLELVRLVVADGDGVPT